MAPEERALFSELVFGERPERDAEASASQRLSGEMFNKLAGVKIERVPYKASPQALGDVAAGQVQIMFPDLPQALREKTSAEQMSAYLASSAGEALRAQAALVQQHLGEPFVLGGRGGGAAPASDAEATLPLGERRSARLTQERDGEGARWVINALQ